MTTHRRSIAVAAIGALVAGVACKGAESARAKTPPPTATSEQAAPATAAAPVASSQAGATDPLLARADSARVRGNPSAKIWMIIASDFQCPYCRMWHDSSDAIIRRDYIDDGKVRLAFVNFPIPSHRNAIPAAEYAMCAAGQDKFWPMHDALFAAQEKWTPLADPGPAFEQLAATAGVDVAALRACVSSHKMRPLIEADREKLAQAGVRATPSFFVNDQLIEGVIPTAELKKALDAALAGTGKQ